ncbi:hypothetical protein L1887_07389 [Cichorium endivia]|nr:hypothetical protein L1887_07389 [Cichorium endivia]
MNKETIPHGLTFAPFSDGHDDGQEPTTTLTQLISDFDTKGPSAMAEIISSVAAAGQPFDHLVCNNIIPWAPRVANAHGIKSSLLWIMSATISDIFYYYFNGYQGLISDSINNPTVPIELPGLPQLTTADLPTFLLPSHPKELEFVIGNLKGQFGDIKTPLRILVNTFNELEVESIRAIEKIEYYPIGPLIPSEFLEGKDSQSNSLGSDFFKKPEEIAAGLLESRRPFLWVIRDSEQAGSLSKIEELKKHGMIVSWCSQVVVLSHQAVGCFVMHGGWNSTVETLVAGVPAVVFPQWSDQGTNAKMVEDVWRTGVRVRRREGDGVVKGKEIERCVEFVMGDEDIKRNAEKWRKLAREALSDGGSSTVNLQAFLNDVCNN